MENATTAAATITTPTINKLLAPRVGDSTTVGEQVAKDLSNEISYQWDDKEQRDQQPKKHQLALNESEQVYFDHQPQEEKENEEQRKFFSLFLPPNPLPPVLFHFSSHQPFHPSILIHILIMCAPKRN